MPSGDSRHANGTYAPPLGGAVTDLARHADVDQANLRSALVDLAQVAMGSIDESLGRIASLAARAVPDADAAGVTMLDTGRHGTTAASAEIATAVDAVQYELGNGPCITAAAERRTVLSGSLGDDPAWPRFGARARDLGVNSVLSLVLVVDDEVVGALNVYARAVDAFDQAAVRLGEAFAVPAAVAVYNARLLTQAQRLAGQLEAALTNRAVIDQAIGISMSRQGTTADEAMARLRETSQGRNIKISVLAQQLVDEAVRRARARHAQP